MKNIVSILLMLFVCTTLSAQGIRIYWKNGSFTKYTYADIDSLVAYDYNSDVECLNFDPQEAVDLGLSVKWAAANLCAEMPERSGDKFAWGETETKGFYDFVWAKYKLCKGDKYSLTKYCPNGEYGTKDNKKILEPIDDAAHVIMGGDWRMPSVAEMEELLTLCRWEKMETPNNVWGMKVTGPSGNSIFFIEGHYWTREIYTDREYYAYNFDISYSTRKKNYYTRCDGYFIRPVCPK